MRKIDSPEELDVLLAPFDGQASFTNVFFFKEELVRLINASLLFHELCGENLFLYKYREDLNFYEVFYFINNVRPGKCPDQKGHFVMEIPYRGIKNFPHAMVDFWLNAGFQQHINRDLLGLNHLDKSILEPAEQGFKLQILNDITLSSSVFEGIANTFDKYTGDVISLSAAKEAIQAGQVLGAYSDGKLVGFLHFYDKNSVSWIGHLVVFPRHKGKGIGKALVKHYLKIRSEQGFANFQQWVVSDNTSAQNLYRNFGFKSTNKCSLSLLKL